jgi:hypothetical protein
VILFTCKYDGTEIIQPRERVTYPVLAVKESDSCNSYWNSQGNKIVCVLTHNITSRYTVFIASIKGWIRCNRNNWFMPL